MTEIPPPGPERNRLVAETIGCKSIKTYSYTQEVESDYWHGPDGRPMYVDGMLTHVIPELSTDDATFVRECLPWLQAKMSFTVRWSVGLQAWQFTDQPAFNPTIGFIVMGKTLSSAGTAFILKAKEVGLI